MSGGINGIRLYCEHVSKNHVHCNWSTSVPIDMDQTPREVIEASDWTLVNGEVRCEEHQ